MKQVDRSFPLPYFVVSKDFKIQSYSREAKDIFGEYENILDLMDEDSHRKVKEWVTPKVTKATLEVHVKPLEQEADLLTADMYVNWENELFAEIIFLIKDKKLSNVTHILQKLRTRLDDTNFELLKEKEKLEEVIELNNQLSAPFITLDGETALVPLFGQITAQKMYAIENHLLASSRESGVDHLMFDFTGVSILEEDGIHVFLNVIASLFHMGSEITFIGIKPQIAQSLNDVNLPSKINFMGSLQAAVAKYC